MFNLSDFRNRTQFAKLGYYHVYLHFPFCHAKCPFCCFMATFKSKELTNFALIPAYVEAMKFEIECYDFPRKPLESIVIGGGTPALLRRTQVEQLIAAILERAMPTLVDPFVTSFETTPELAVPEKLEAFHSAGMRRVSIGVQSYFAEDLKILGRHNSPDQSLAAFEAARSVGYQDINIDLLGGFPGATFEKWQKNLEIVFQQDPEFCTINMLAYGYHGANRYVDSMEKRGVRVPSFDERVRMYRYALEQLDLHDYQPVSLAVFAKNGRAFSYEVHGLGMADNVIAFGPGALSALEDRVCTNPPFVEEYIKSPLGGKYTSSYRDNIYQIVHGHLLGAGKVSEAELGPVIGCELSEAIEESDYARNLVQALDRNGWIEWVKDGFQLCERYVAEAVISIWDYQAEVSIMV